LTDGVSGSSVNGAWRPQAVKMQAVMSPITA